MREAAAPAGPARSALELRLLSLRPAPTVPGSAPRPSPRPGAARAAAGLPSFISPQAASAPLVPAAAPTEPALAPSSAPPLQLGREQLRLAMEAARHPMWRAADAAGQTLDSEGPQQKERLAAAMAATAKPDCLGKDSAPLGLFALIVVPVQMVRDKCKMP
jgi:hypothetical protein